LNRLQTVKADGGLRKRGACGVPRLLGARSVALLLACAAVAAIFAAGRAAGSSTPSASAEPAPSAAVQRARQRRPQRRRTQPRRPAIDYSRFNHSTPEHRSPRRECSACHVIPSLAGPGAAAFPKGPAAKFEVTDFPDHPSCVECHRQQFFRGARPVICSNCHTVTGPRSEARFKFPKPNEAAEFADAFPHNRHTDANGLAAFRDKLILGPCAPQNDTCLYCHKLDNDRREFRQVALPSASPCPPPSASATPPPSASPRPEGFPVPGTYMLTATSHGKCFQCHWQEGVEGRKRTPYADDCAGCHKNIALRQQPAAGPAAAAAAPSPAASPAPAGSPALSRSRPSVPPSLVIPATFARFRVTSEGSWPARVSPQFTHVNTSHSQRTVGAGSEAKQVDINCTTCHAAVRRADGESLEKLKAAPERVVLLSCSTSACHTAPSSSSAPPGKQSIYRELRERSTNAKSDCKYCHVPPISLGPVPCNHYEVVLTSLKREKKSTQAIEKLIAGSEQCKDKIKIEGR
jgi:hypothetical protein